MVKDKTKKLIIYELNEVPLKVLKKYIKINPQSNFAKLCKEGFLKETITQDQGELHPWSTWPTVHRGVNNNIHQIQFINQNLDFSKNWPPIWEVLLKNNISTGIFGSLQSYPPIKNDLVAFYLPDTFSPEPDAIPKKLIEFQKFNLFLTGKNKAISRKINLKDYIKFFNLVIKGYFEFRTIFLLGKHIFMEIIHPINKSLRSLMQPILGFDIYFKLLKKEKPYYSSFFTNHVAGMMHRYWKYTFPEDFEENKNFDKFFHSKSIFKAMNIADYQIGKLFKFCNTNNYELWVISSMGQEAIKRDDYYPEIYVSSIKKIIKAIGLNYSNYKLLPAMQPDICISCKNRNCLSDLLSNIKKIKDSEGNTIFQPRYSNDGLNINISIKHSRNAYQTKKLYVAGKSFKSKELSIEFVKRDIGTGYHNPKGIYIGYGSKSKKLFNTYKNKLIDTKDFFQQIKRYFSI